MTEYISRGDFTSDVSFNRYKAILVEYNNLKQLKKRVEDRIKQLNVDSKTRTFHQGLDTAILQELQQLLKGDKP